MCVYNVYSFFVDTQPAAPSQCHSLVLVDHLSDEDGLWALAEAHEAPL